MNNFLPRLIAVAFAARLLGTTAKVVMPKTANPFRVQSCRSYGAEVELVENVAAAFARVQVIQFDVRSEQLRKQISRELRTLHGSRHPNIVTYHQSFLQVTAVFLLPSIS